MESNNIIQNYFSLLDEFIYLYKNIQEIFSINLNDSLKSLNIQKILSSELIKDTILILSQNNYNINKILEPTFLDNNSNLPTSQEKTNNNLFVIYSKKFESLINNRLILNQEKDSNSENIQGHFLQNIERDKIYKIKKNHEVKKLSEFIISTNQKSETFLEMGCGKSYLTDALIKSEKNILYIGIDMNINVITKAKKTYKKNKNIYLLDGFITSENFEEFYSNMVKSILSQNKKLAKNIFLFGLHSCGNLTSNTLKMFIKYDYFKSVAIVGCCLHLLNEYINPETKNSKEFLNYYNNIGKDKNGNFLDNTLIFEKNENIGYPLSEYISNKYKNFYLGRAVRNTAMQNNTENAEYDSELMNKNFYRALLQKFLENNLEEYANIYGLGKIKLDTKNNFCDYVRNYLIDVKKNEKNDNLINKIDIILKNIEEKCNKFYEEYKEYKNYYFALNLIRVKFAKIVEYIVALDRIIYLNEQGIKKCKLIRIFNNHISPRNLLIYAYKD